MSQKVC